LKLDYTLESPEERKALVEKILEENPNPSERYLEILADYLVLCVEKQEKKERKLLTDNRMATVNKRETSLEGLISQFENGEDGIYNLMVESNKNTIFQPKVTITKKDLEEIPELRQLRDAIESWERRLKQVSGHDAFVAKKTIIELRKEQYLIKNAVRKPIIPNKLVRSKHYITYEEGFSFDKDGYVIPEGVSFCDPKVISAILCNYFNLKKAAQGQLEKEIWYVLHDFDLLVSAALVDYPLYSRLVDYKIAGYQNIEIQELLNDEFGIKHSLEYISSLWRNKIPKLIAEVAEEQFLDWYYLNIAPGQYKRCSRCGELKLAHNKFFSKNKTSKDSFYSICKKCRNKKLGKIN